MRGHWEPDRQQLQLQLQLQTQTQGGSISSTLYIYGAVLQYSTVQYSHLT